MSRRRRGFTLIEVVIALGLGVLLLLGVQRIVVHAHRAAQAVEAVENAEGRESLPFSILGGDLASLPAGASFVLRDAALEFRTLNALQSQRMAARHTVNVRYSWRQAESGGFRLLRTEWELDRAPGEKTGFPLAVGRTRVSFEIYDGQRWHQRWPLRTRRSARAIRLRLERRDESRERVLPLKPMRWSRHND